jgi:hypothetical protein
VSQRVRHTPEDLERLQALLDRSAADAGPALRSVFGGAERSVRAPQLARYLDQDRPFALATVTARGEPRTAPVMTVFFRATLHVPTMATALRVGHVVKRPAVSLTHWSDRLAVIVHGRAEVLYPDHPDFAGPAALIRSSWWDRWTAEGVAVWLRIDAAAIFTRASDPGAFRPD